MAHESSKSPSNVSPNYIELISKVSELSKFFIKKKKEYLINFENDKEKLFSTFAHMSKVEGMENDAAIVKRATKRKKKIEVEEQNFKPGNFIQFLLALMGVLAPGSVHARLSPPST